MASARPPSRSTCSASAVTAFAGSSPSGNTLHRAMAHDYAPRRCGGKAAGRLGRLAPAGLDRLAVDRAVRRPGKRLGERDGVRALEAGDPRAHELAHVLRGVAAA